MIQAHPARTEAAGALAVECGGRVVFDPEPHGYPSPWRTYRACLESADPAVSHLAVLQDDCEPCVHLALGAAVVASKRPGSLVSLFVGGNPRTASQALLRACRGNERFCVLPPGRWVPAVALLWPVELIAPVVAWVDEQHYPETFRADDEIIGRATTALGLPVLATVPSLVEHPDDLPSLIRPARWARGRDPGRSAVCFIDGDPLDLDWG